MPATRRDSARMAPWLAILLVSMAGLLLEVSYTRIVSFKLWYYYTYLVIGLALLGIGSGGVCTAVWPAMRRWSSNSIVAVCSTIAALTTPLGFFVIARLRVNTISIWDYGTSESFENLAKLFLICFILFATFVAMGIIISVLLGRAGDRVGRIYFADLLGAGIGCLLAVPLIWWLDPPSVIALSSLIFGVVAVFTAVGNALRPVRIISAIACVALAVLVVADEVLPSVRPEDGKLQVPTTLSTQWGPVFRVDVVAVPNVDDNRLLIHDGTYGSGIWEWDGDVSTLGRYQTDTRAIPFLVRGGAPPKELIIGSAGGQEILASLHFGAPDIEAVELNPVTVGLLKDEFADFTGHLTDRDDVDVHVGDGRSYLARQGGDYDLIWYVAPDSYAATNAASSGAFVLSESYLYTTEMIKETLEHLDDDGIMVVQFGELDFEHSPNRTSRYVVTAREALDQLGTDDAPANLLVAASLTAGPDLSTILVKRTPFTDEEIENFRAGIATVPDTTEIHSPGAAAGESVVSRLASGTNDEVDRIVADAPKDITAISDDAPYFWHFSPFPSVMRHIFEPLDVQDPEDVIGERVLLLLLGIAVVYAAVFLLAPFILVRRQWRALPKKGVSAIYFAALGLGFMFFEITMIQRLTLLLGYPTYSLTVTLAAILVFSGFGSLLSSRFAGRGRHTEFVLLGALAVLTAFYQLALDDITGAVLDQSLAIRIVITLLLLAPLGLCLGMFMPLGLGRVRTLSADGEQYVAWSWAVNGFFSVIGSVLTTILSMTFGFQTVQLAGLAVYVIAVLAFTQLPVGAATTVSLDEDDEAPVLAPT